MHSVWSNIAARERETRALADRLELRIHVIALTLTAIVLGMRLVAGTRDLALDDERYEESRTVEPGAGAYPYGL